MTFTSLHGKQKRKKCEQHELVRKLLATITTSQQFEEHSFNGLALTVIMPLLTGGRQCNGWSIHIIY